LKSQFKKVKISLITRKMKNKDTQSYYL